MIRLGHIMAGLRLSSILATNYCWVWGGEQHLLFCSCGHSQMKGLKMESVFMIWMIWKTVDDTSTTFCFLKFVISDLVGRSKHNNDPSDAVIVSHLRKYSFFSAVRVEIGWETQDLLFSSHHSICLRPAFWISGGKKGSITSYCPFVNIHDSDLQL